MITGAGPSGFYNAPVTKAMVVGLGINTILASLLDVRHKFAVALWPQVFQHHQFYRLLTTHLYFATASQLLFGTALIYQFRLLERQWSSAKYASFVFLTTALATGLNAAAAIVSRAAGFKTLAKGLPIGPYGLVFAALYTYASGIPDTSKLRLAGKEVGHFFLYAMGAQFFLTQAPQSLVSSACGILAGIAWDVNLLEMRSFRLPKVIRNVGSKLFAPFASSAPPDRLTGTTLEDQRRELRERYAATMRGNPVAGTAPVAVGPPSPDAVAHLEAMGFDRARVLRALSRTNNNVQVAAAFLIDERQ